MGGNIFKNGGKSLSINRTGGMRWGRPHNPFTKNFKVIEPLKEAYNALKWVGNMYAKAVAYNYAGPQWYPSTFDWAKNDEFQDYKRKHALNYNSNPGAASSTKIEYGQDPFE